ncbi:F-box/LRR-repeat protein 17 isoform X2 [Hyla sarda]|uniref:F-box/LRR-repeat protein 17 isoform X2 n=1 Tax=Hyla sarda TaxID=327740 RepID=UPI0024C365E1|nr:F-box/LRR-repeat protein 17 isoform X2 [Hyla sarda]
MGSLFCKQRRGPTPARAQRRKKKLQHSRRDCLLRAPCMLCFLVREPAVSEPVPPAPRAQDCAHLLLLNNWPERTCTVLRPGLTRTAASLETDMVCKRKNSGDSQQPGTPCKQPRCAPEGQQSPPGGQGHRSTQEHTPPCAGDQGHHSTQEHTPPCAGDQGHHSTQEHHPPCAGDQGHHSTQKHTPPCAGDQGHHSTQKHTPPCAGDQGHHSTQEHTPPCAGDQGHHSTQEYTPPCAGDQGHHSTQKHTPPCAGDQGHHSTQKHTPPCAGDQGHHSTQEHTPPCAGDQGHHSTQEHTPPCAGDQGHHSTQEYTPPCAGDQGHHSTQEHTPPCAGDQGHHSTQEYTPPCAGAQGHHMSQENTPPCTGDKGHHIPSYAGAPLNPALFCAEEPAQQTALEYTEKDGMPPLEEHCGVEPNSLTHSTSPRLGTSSQSLQTVRDADPDTPRMEDEPLNINQLPPSLLLKIFSHLSFNERCLCVSLVCKYWQDLCLDFQFWKQLDLSSHCQIKDDILERIASRFWNILELNISDCLNLTDVGIGMVAAKWSGLLKYTAYRCKQLSDSSLISLATHCTSLQKVHVGNQDRLTDEAIKQLGSRCKDLRDIHFGQCYKISDDGMIIIANGCPKLKKIYMQENKLVSDKSVEAFAEHCPELEYVGFMGCSVTSRGVIRLTNLKNLSSLDLRHINELDNETVMEIVKKCQNLTSLNLCLNRNIDDRCVEVIAKEGRSLKELYLVTCKITDHALIAIGRYSTTIETVDVGWCKEITDQGATLIAQSSKSIRYLGLMRCDQVNEATVEQLVQQYPHITFSTVLQDCKRTLERAYQMGWTPNASSMS